VRSEVSRNFVVADDRKTRNAIVRSAPRHTIRVEK